MVDDLRSDDGLGGFDGHHHRPVRRSNDGTRPLADREVPLGQQEQDGRVLAPAVHAWLDGELPEASVRKGDTARDVEFWKMITVEVEQRRHMRTPVNLEAQIKEVADRNRVILLNHQIQPAPINLNDKNADFQPLTVQTDVKGDWGSMVRFASSLQQPDKFIVFESATLRIDRDDPKMIKGEFHIAKWYAPAGK